MPVTQANRAFAVTTTLGKDVLLFRSMTATEHLGRLFEFDLYLLSEKPDIELESLLGTNVTVEFKRPDGKLRYFNGYVSRFSQAGSHGRYVEYEMTLRSWLWFLTRTADCRIFQDMSVPDIVKKIFRDHGFSDFKDALTGKAYRTWEYCVQYRETDFNFVSRLLEQEGIYYYFEHDKGKHTLVLCDSISAHGPVPGYEKIPYFPIDEHKRRDQDHIYGWHVTQEVQPGAYVLTDFDFKKPNVKLEAKDQITRKHDMSEFEIFDFPGEYAETKDGENYAKVRLDELQVSYEAVEGQGDAAGLSAGNLFKLTGYPRKDQNREYLVLSATHEMRSNEYESSSQAGQEDLYSCGFTAMESKTPFRAQRVTPKPVVQGPQTAIVVGPNGEEIWTDKYGRVKVQFHWDREGKEDENSSCWMRVAQIWAGKNWGGMQIPRIGHEVMVEFLEGDPDRPIITGCVYNKENMPPYPLPANATQSGIKSRSSKDGDQHNFNELRFEDKKDEEEVYFHAERDFNRVVENNDTLKVGFDKMLDGDQTVEIHNNQTTRIGNSGSNDGSQTIEIWKNRDTSLEQGNDELVLMMGNRTTTLKAGNDRLEIQMGSQNTEAMNSIELKVGQNSITIDQSGITIKGIMIKIEGQAQVGVKAPMTDIKGDGMVKVNGGIIMIN